MCVIFFWSARPAITTSTIGWQDFTIKKSAHIVEYLILGLLTYRSFKKTTGLSTIQVIIFTVVGCLLYAISDEIHQSFTPGRSPMVRDVALDTIGSALGVVIMHFAPYNKN
jgi:VanZ family protein